LPPKIRFYYIIGNSAHKMAKSILNFLRKKFCVFSVHKYLSPPALRMQPLSNAGEGRFLQKEKTAAHKDSSLYLKV